MGGIWIFSGITQWDNVNKFKHITETSLNYTRIYYFVLLHLNTSCIIQLGNTEDLAENARHYFDATFDFSNSQFLKTSFVSLGGLRNQYSRRVVHIYTCSSQAEPVREN